MFCWKCKQKLEEKKVPFHAVCKNCQNDLHVCKNCRFFTPGKPHDCNIPDIELVIDKERSNFCDEFMPSETLIREEKKDPKEIAKKLFKDS